MARRQIVSVESISLVLMRTDPPQLLITAHGYASSSGWSNAALELIDALSELSSDGVLDFNFMAQPPSGISLAVLTPMVASFVWTKDAERVVAVRIVARTNQKTEMVRNPVFTTFALGEETPTFPKWPPKFPLGEVPPKPPWIREIPPSPYFGEHWPPIPSGPFGENPQSPFPGDPGWTDPIPGNSPFGGGST